MPGCAVRPAWCHRGRAGRPRGAPGVRWRGRSVVAGAAVRPAGKAYHAQKLPVPGVCPVCGALPVRDARARARFLREGLLGGHAEGILA